MKKITFLLMAWLTVGAAYAAVGDVITDGTFYFTIIAEGEANEVEFAQHPDGNYTITNRLIFGSYNTVTIDGVTYNVVGIGEGAFRNAQFPTTAGITNMPTGMRYIKDYAFEGAKSGKSADTNAPVRIYGNLESVSPLAFINNRLVGSITVGNGTDHLKQVANIASKVGANNGNQFAPCLDGTTLVAVANEIVLGTGSSYVKPEKLTIGEDFTIIGPYAMYGNSVYTQLDLGNVEEIKEQAFKNCVVKELTLPATLTTAASDAFEGCTSINSITCNALTPPPIVFEGVVYTTIAENGQITVPEEALETYKADENWGRFWIPPAFSELTYEATPEHGFVFVMVGNETIESGTTVKEGTEVTITVIPDDNYEVSAVTVETVAPEGGASGAPRRASVPVSVGDNNTFTFEMPAEPVAINVTIVPSELTAVRDLRAAGYNGVIYVDMNGRVSTTPFKGVNIVVNGDGTVTKMVK